MSEETPTADDGAEVATTARGWAWAGLLAQIAFVGTWIAAATWQGPRYSTVSDTISDMYAVTAPHGMILVVVLTVCGAATIGFALFSVLALLRRGGWPGLVGGVLLALSIFGLGDLLTPTERLACRMADPGCTAQHQVSNLGGTMDNILSSAGIVLFVVACFFLAPALRRLPEWRQWAWPTRAVAIAMIICALLDTATQQSGLGGFFERLLALLGAGLLFAIAVRVVRLPRRGSHSATTARTASA